MEKLVKVFSSGSSPRMRGALGVDTGDELYFRIIPAYAGSTRFQGLNRRPSRDHPRVCGEHDGSFHCFTISAGSSPRMRGAHLTGLVEDIHEGIIPAYAGSTTRVSGKNTRWKDHPRVGGEHPATALQSPALLGSSPRMRGALNHPPAWPKTPGIIPAYAGSTSSCQLLWHRKRDHPRVCGEHLWAIWP